MTSSSGAKNSAPGPVKDGVLLLPRPFLIVVGGPVWDIYIHTYIHIHFLFDFIHILFKYVYTYVLTQYGHAESGNEPRAGPIQSLARLCILEQYITVGYKVV